MQNKLLPLMIAVALSGCSMAPDYHQPKSASEQQGWSNAITKDKAETVLPTWRDFMADPRLQRLITKALANNKDLRQTILAVGTMRAKYDIQDAERYPSLTADGSSTKIRTSDKVTGTGDYYTDYRTASLGFTSYELDLFGRVKSLTDEALENYLAQDETRRSAVISLISEVATDYMTLLADRELLKLSEDTVQTYEKTLKLVQTRYNAGYSSALTLAQSKTALYGAQATVAQYKLAVAREYNTLRQLVGAPIDKEIDGTLPEENGKVLAALKVGISSKLLLNRPDVRAAEHTLKADNANIGAARAAFFPSISLTGAYGSRSSSLGDLFSSNSGYWSFTPAISLPIFDWGSNKASLNAAKIVKQSSIIAYRQTIETAFKEVDDALVGQQYYKEEWDAQKSNLSANEQYYKLAKMRYDKGNDSYIDLLDAQRSLFSAQESELTAHLSLLTSRVNLYKALGGGWQAADDEQSTSVKAAVDEAIK